MVCILLRIILPWTLFLTQVKAYHDAIHEGLIHEASPLDQAISHCK